METNNDLIVAYTEYIKSLNPVNLGQFVTSYIKWGLSLFCLQTSLFLCEASLFSRKYRMLLLCFSILASFMELDSYILKKLFKFSKIIAILSLKVLK